MSMYHMIKCLKTVSLAATFALVGCGAESGGSNAEKLSEVTDVSGKYTLITSAISVECTDGTTDTSPAIALSGDVIHSGNIVEFRNDNGGAGVGFTVIERDATDGIIEPNGKFIMNSAVLAQAAGINGNLTISYNLSGYFNDTGWSGEYQYSVYFHSVSASCTYISPFTGTKS